MSDTDKLGMTWWNGMTKLERSGILGQAETIKGRPVSAADCWDLWRAGEIRMTVHRIKVYPAGFKIEAVKITHRQGGEHGKAATGARYRTPS